MQGAKVWGLKTLVWGLKFHTQCGEKIFFNVFLIKKRTQESQLSLEHCVRNTLGHQRSLSPWLQAPVLRSLLEAAGLAGPTTEVGKRPGVLSSAPRFPPARMAEVMRLLPSLPQGGS